MSANLSGLLSELARTRSAQPAIIDRHGKPLTFAGLDREAGRLAALLGERGVQVGQRVLLLVPMSPELYVTLAALWRIGLVAVVVDPGAGLGHLRQALKRVPPDVLVGISGAFALMMLPEIRRIPVRVRLGGGWPHALDGSLDWHARPALPPRAHPLPLPGNHPALITFTSGSTAEPKAAVRTHAFLQEQHRVLAHHLHYTAGGLDLVTLPIVALASLASGRTALLPDSSLKRPAQIDTTRVLRQLERHPAETLAASPALLHTLAQAALNSGTRLPMRRIFAGGGPVFPRTLELLSRAAPQAELVSVYGSTEAEPIAHQSWQAVTPADQARTRQGGGLLAGKPVPELHALVLPQQAGPLEYRNFTALQGAALAPGQVGELLVSGGHVLPGYLDGRGDEETKWKDPGGGVVWHRTGDAATFDEQGRLWLMGRAGKSVRDEYGELFPFAVEAAAMTHPAVRRVALLPGKRVLCVEWENEPDSTLKEMLAWAHLHEIRSVRRIPLDRRHNAKVDYVQLQKQLGRRNSGDR